MPDSATFANGLSAYVSEIQRGDGFVNFFKFVLPGLPDSTARLMSTQTIAANDMPSVIAVLQSMAAMIVPPATSGGVPVLFAVGDGDPFVQLSVAATQRVPGSKLVKPADADHFTIMVHPTLMPAMRQLMEQGAR